MSNEDPKLSDSYDRNKKVPEFFGFKRGNTVFSLNKAGEPISRELRWPEEPASAPADTTQVSLPFTVEGMGDTPMLPTGLVIITGETGVGKSSFVRALTKAMAPAVLVRRLLAVEPHDDGQEVLNVPTFSSADSALVEAIVGQYKGGSVPLLYVIDSLRAPLFETGGAAGSKGISMPFFAQITRVSNCLAKAGITVLATVNPMDEDPAYVESFLGKLSASVPATIFLQKLQQSSSGSRFEGSLQMRPNRQKRKFVFDPDAESIVVRTVELSFETVPASSVAPRSSAQLIAAIETSPS